MTQACSPSVSFDTDGWREQLQQSGAQFTIKYVGSALVTISIREVPAHEHTLLAETCMKIVASKAYPDHYANEDIPSKYADEIDVENIEVRGEEVDLNISDKAVLIADGEGLLKHVNIRDISLIVPGREEFRTYLCFFGKTTERQRLTRRCYCFDAGSETMEIYHIMGLAFQLSAQQQQKASNGDVRALYGGRDIAQRSSSSRDSPVTCTPSTSMDSSPSTPRSRHESASYDQERYTGSTRSSSYQPESRDSSLTPRARSRNLTETEPMTPSTPVRSAVILPSSRHSRASEVSIRYPSSEDTLSTYYESIDEEYSRKRFFEITKHLTHEPWFHGPISREEAEARVQTIGDFLVRQSKSHEGQIVLTAMGDGVLKHVFLVDENGSIHTADRRFMSIRELINFYIETKRSLSDVVLATPIRRPELRLEEPRFLRRSPSGSGTQTTHL